MSKALLLLVLLFVAQSRHDILNDEDKKVEEEEEGEKKETSPTTAETTATTEGIKSLDVDNDKEPIDGKLLLQRSLALSNQVKSLTDEIYSLEAAINATNSPYFAQLAQMSANATEMKATLDKLVEQLNTLTARQEKIEIQEENITRMFKCMAESNCVTREPTTESTTTMTTTTTEPTTSTATEPTVSTTAEPTTTTPPLNKCPDVKAEPVTTVEQSYIIPKSENIYCSDVFSATEGMIKFGAHVEIGGKGASLTFFNARTGELIRNITKTEFLEIESKVISVRIVYSADRESFIAFHLVYSAAKVDVCAEFNCGEKGKCVVVPSTGQPMCQCPACESGAHCETKVNPCTNVALRRCNVKAENKCVPNSDIKDYCAYKCECAKTEKVSETQCAKKPKKMLWLPMWKNLY
ncbi:hypothetical protein Aduo_012774 [Ancylostoma duodenale]